jgi:hypothetical protein
LRLRGHVFRVNGLFDQAEARYREALELARDTANVAAEGKALTDLAQTMSWSRPSDELDLQPRALETNTALRNQVEVVKIRAASAVALTRTGNHADAGAQIQEGSNLAHQCGYRGGLVWCQVAQAFNQLARDDVDGARATAGALAETVSELQGNRFWSEIVNWWIDPAANGRDQAATTNWLDGIDAAKARWLTLRPSGAGATQGSV